MTDKQWELVKAIVNGEKTGQAVSGFIIDCPWLPEWYGISILDYFSNDELWLQANLKAITTFPDVIFLPGFWSEYGMCTEPSAFGAKNVFFKNEFPFANKVIHSTEDIDNLTVPNPETDGLLPFMLNRLVIARPAIEAVGHKIHFSVSRGPLNIASFLMGTTEFLTTMMMDPDATHRLMRIITDFLKSWHKLQHDTIDSIDGIMMLDDIVGFMGEDEFMEFAYPYLKELYDTNDTIKLFHNDADCTQSVKYYPELGINLYNPGIHMSLAELREATGNKIAILGNIPPRDVLAAGSPDEVSAAAKALKTQAEGFDRILFSCAGGMPPAVTTENIQAFIDALK
ncbi:MAG: uroporphyrinogen decarboxylase family protein [Bacteroidales bacterium]|nr:uroporphyrinogen decarboxylase family protein [Bacteroidales bacterium]